MTWTRSVGRRRYGRICATRGVCCAMRGSQTFGDLHREIDRRRCESLPRGAERLAIDQLADQEIFADIVNGDDVATLIASSLGSGSFRAAARP